MQPVLIDNGKSPDEPYNAALGFWLPTDSPYGNFSLKLVKLSSRIDEANRRIRESFGFWNDANVRGILPTNAYEQHIYSSELAIYLIRRAADELIALMWCLSQWEVLGDYPEDVAVDCIGAAIEKPSDLAFDVVSKHEKVLCELNEIANAFKHSFLQTDITLFGSSEPRVHTLSLSRNKLGADAKFYDVPLKQLIQEFSAFYTDSLGWLGKFSERHRDNFVGDGTPSSSRKGYRD